MSGPDGVVAEATADDADAVRVLLTQHGLPVDGLDTAWRSWVVRDDGRVVAAAALERYPTGSGSGDATFLLRSVVVDERCRGRGLAGRLVATALAAADEAAPPATVALLTETADGYFDRFGFRSVPRTALPRVLENSAELRTACPATARAYLRP